MAFDDFIDQCRARAYRRDLWAAAYIINGGCSDDGFEYFRAWLIAQGQRIFEDAIRDPASLETAIPMDSGWDAELESLLYVAGNAYRQKTGREIPRKSYAAAELTGAEWTDKNVEHLHPDLAARANARYNH